MGHGHAVMGAAVWLAVADPYGPTLTRALPQAWQHGAASAGAAGLVAGLVLWAGASLSPDLDTGSSIAARSTPGVSWLASRAVRVAASDKHRGFSHSLLGAAGFGLAAWAAANFSLHTAYGPVLIGEGLCVWLIVASALQALHLPISRGMSVLAGLFAGAACAWAAPIPPITFAVAVAGGCVTHMVGDTLTTEGCPWLWPAGYDFRTRTTAGPLMVRLPILGHTGSWREHILVAGLALYAVVAVYYTAKGYLSAAPHAMGQAGAGIASAWNKLMRFLGQ